MNKNDFFHWLYEPLLNDNMLINNAIEICHKCNIPDILVIIKYIKQLIYYNTNLTKDAIVEHLIHFDICKEYNIEEIDKIISYAFWIPMHNIENKMGSKHKINELTKNIIIQENKEKIVYHDGYPIPDINLGRPKLEWLECYHAFCHRKFNSTESLINHLTDSGVYTHGLHASHDFIVGMSGLTPEKVYQKNMTKCPAYICNKSDIIMTPTELCHHFMILGIFPFWQPGINLNPPENDEQKEKLETTGKIFFDEPTCLICYENEISLIFLPCLHYYTCINCGGQIGDKCPICKTKITHKIPY